MAMYEYITNEGYRLLQRMLMGEVTLDFTRVEMGDGNSPETDLKKVTALSNVVVSLEVDSVVKQENNTISISALFTNEKLEKGFYFREKGVFAKGLDGSGTEQEILFAYANAADTANYIDPPTVELVEKKIISHCTQCQKTDGVIDIVIKSGIYADIEYVNQMKDTLETHLLNKANPHGVDAKQLGLDKVNNTSDVDKPVSTLQQQAIDDSKTADSVTGENPTATNSTDGSVPYLRLRSNIEQKTLSGKNLLDFNLENISFTATDTYRSYAKATNPFSKGAGTYYYSCEGSIVGSHAYRLWVYDKSGSLIINTSNKTSIELTEDEANSIGSVQIVIENVVNGTAYSGSLYPMITYEDSDTTYEPYCGGTASPNPDYQQRIGASADKGYFDGVLLQGYRSGLNGSLVTSNASGLVTNRNKISCKENDVIVLHYEEEVSSMKLAFFDENGSFISSLGESANNVSISEKEVVAPANSSYFYFNLGWNGNSQALSPSTAKHICVTINGQYVLRVKTSNKNLLTYSFTSGTIQGLTVVCNSDDSLKFSGTTTAQVTYQHDDAIDKLEVGKTYILSGVQLLKVTENGTSHYLAVNNEREYTITDKTTSFKPYYQWESGVTVNETYYPMLREKGTDDTYVPHQESEALIPVSAPFYNGDYIKFFADGSGQIVRESVRFNPTSISNVREFTEGVAGVIALSKGHAKERIGKCNYLVSLADKSNGSFYFGDNATGKYSSMFFFIDGLTTKEEYQAWLDEHSGFEVVYKLTTPTTEPLTAEQVAEFLKLRTYKGVTYVNADGDVVMRYYVNSDSGETVSMLQGMVEKLATITVDTGDLPEYVEWTKSTVVEDSELNKVFYIDELDIFIAGGFQSICTSKDGVSWDVSLEYSGFDSIAYGNGKLVAVATSGSIQYSEDGVTWTSLTGHGVSERPRDIAYGNGKFVISCNSGATYYSTDGITWVKNEVLSDDSNMVITYGYNKFVLIDYNNNVYYSRDGITWMVGDTAITSNHINDIIYANDMFIAVGGNGKDGAIYFSKDGVFWEPCNVSGNFNAITYDGEKFIAVGWANMMYSKDGKTWIEIDSLIKSTEYMLNGIAYGNGKYVLTEYNDTTIYYSNLETIKEQRNLEEAINELYSLLKA